MLEVASIHVPKAGGTSFLGVLGAWYGEDLSWFYRCAGRIDPILPWTRCVHGHFNADFLAARRRITWMRDPARRAVSHFYYWRATPPVAIIDPLHLDVLAGRISLLEFAAHPEIRNLHTAYYGASTVADFDFIGIMEHQDSEMQRLAHILDKPVLSLPRDNVTRSEEYAAFKASPEFDETVAAIRQLNLRDQAFYDKACAAREEWVSLSSAA